MNANDIPLLRSIELLAILCDVLVKGAVLLFAASLITMAMRKASAAARHLVWAIALCGVLMLPLFSVRGAKPPLAHPAAGYNSCPEAHIGIAYTRFAGPHATRSPVPDGNCRRTGGS